MDQGKIDQQIEALRDLGRQVRELHAKPGSLGGQRNEQHFTLHGGHWIAQLFVAACFSCAVVSVVLYIRAGEEWDRQKLEMTAQRRADEARMERDIDALRNKVETQQAYVNEIYRSLKR